MEEDLHKHFMEDVAAKLVGFLGEAIGLLVLILLLCADEPLKEDGQPDTLYLPAITKEVPLL